MLASLLMALSLPVHAGAYYFVDAGTRGMARGGAYIASNRDITAQYYNPAALINLESGQVMINFSLVDQSAAFTRMDLDDDGGIDKTYKKVDNIAAPMKIPSFGIAHHFGLPNTMFAIGLHPPYAPDKEYTAKSAQRYTLIDAKVTQFYTGISAAHQPLPWLTIGASLLWNMTAANQELAINVCNAYDGVSDEPQSCESSGQQETDLVIAMTMKDPGKLTGNFGLLIDPHEQVSIGLSVMPPINVKGKGALQAEFSEKHWLYTSNFIEERTTKDNDITVELTMPWVFRGGLAFRPMETLEIEFAMVYERWRTTKETLVTDVSAPLVLTDFITGLAQLDETVPINGPVRIPQKYRDSISYRLGGEWEALESLSLRTGLYYERSAIPNKNMGVSLMDGNKVGYGIGFSYHLYHAAQAKKILSFDLAFSQSFLGTRKIRNSELRQLQVPIDLNEAIENAILANVAGESIDGALSTKIGRGPVVGNGDISSTLTMMTAGVNYYFGRSTKRTYNQP